MERAMGGFFISVDELKPMIGAPDAPVILDVRRRATFDESRHVLPTARWLEHTSVGDWGRGIESGSRIVVYCVHGHNVSQLATAALRRLGLDARTLSGGIQGWREAGGLTLRKTPFWSFGESRPSRWVTRIRPKIDRIACPWLISRFIDPQAEFYYVEPEQVVPVAEELGALPFDVQGVELSHRGEGCTFDTLLDEFGIENEALRRLSIIIRGADTARLDLAPQAAGLLAVSFGISALAGDDDYGALRQGYLIYDALYAWLRFAAGETHNWPVQKK
jgi:rhodanese-related sulfurtransferase